MGELHCGFWKIKTEGKLTNTGTVNSSPFVWASPFISGRSTFVLWWCWTGCAMFDYVQVFLTFLSKKPPSLSKYCVTYNFYSIRAIKKTCFVFLQMGSYTVWCAARSYLFRKGWSRMSSPVQFCARQFHCWVRAVHIQVLSRPLGHPWKPTNWAATNELPEDVLGKQGVQFLCWRWFLLESFLQHKYLQDLTADATQCRRGGLGQT